MTKPDRRRKHASILFSTSVIALTGFPQVAGAQTNPCAGNTAEICVVNNSATVGDIAPDRAIRINNSGTIGAITQDTPGYLVIDNRAGGTIGSVTFAGTVHPSQLPLPPAHAPSAPLLIGNVLINAGTITGDAHITPGGVFVNAGGQVKGSLVSAFDPFAPMTSAFFINRAGGMGVEGSVNFGGLNDYYITSFAASGSLDLGAARPATFERSGAEALGATTIVNLTGTSQNFQLWGDGIVVNKGTINSGPAFAIDPARPFRLSALGYGGIADLKREIFLPADPIFGFIGIAYDGALTSVINEGTINGDVSLRTARFENKGGIYLWSSDLGTLIFGAADKDFTFINTGSIRMEDTGQRGGPDVLQLQHAVNLVSALDSTVPKAVTIVNDDEIYGGLTFNGIASEFIFDNSGEITMGNNPNFLDRAVEISIGRLNGLLHGDDDVDVLADKVTVTNSGILKGGMDIEAVAKTFSFVNNGTISQDDNDAEAEALQIEITGFDVQGTDDEIDAESVSVVNNGTIKGTVQLGEMEATAVTFTNSGTITRDATPAAAFAQGYSGVEIEQETILGSTLTFTNSGTISTADYAGTAVSLSAEAGDVGSGNPGALTANANIAVVNSGTIRSSGGSYFTPGQLADLTSNDLVADFAAGLVARVDAEGTGAITITNTATGVINSRALSHIGLPNGPQLIPDQAANTGGLAVVAAGGNVSIVNNGTILGGQSGALILPNGIVIKPLADVNFDNVIGGAIDTFDSVDIVLNGATGVIEGGIALREGDDIIENYGSIIGNVFLGAGNDTFIQSLLGRFEGIADGGAGEDTLAFDITGATYTGAIDPVLRAKFINFEIEKLIGTGTVVANEEIAVSEGGSLTLDEGSDLDVGAGNTAISGSGTVGETLANKGTVTGDIDMRGGDNSVTNQGTVNGDVAAGDGNNSFANAADGTIAGDVSFGNGANILANQGTIAGNVALGNGGNSFTNAGHVQGDIDFGSGNDELVLIGDWAIGGGVNGGAGTDIVQATFPAQTVNEDDLPILDLSGFQQIEQFNVNGGTGKIGGTATFEEIAVNSGRLIGAADSIINANVDVAAGGTFGSAGTVNGDIAVGAGGTLSPGASPAVMNITGNVSLVAGSNTFFEMTPTISDAIVIDGTLVIADGARLTLTGNRPLTPGLAYDLITATDGITGSFATSNIDKAATVLGFIRQTDEAIQLLGTFQLHGGANPQVARTTDYLNALLIGGGASNALLDTVPGLVGADGFGDEAALGRLHPEAYASASQIGVENGLALAKAARAVTFGAHREEPGFFGFGQGFGSWRRLQANAGRGTTGANVHASGILGGLGYGNAQFALGAFVGRVDSSQKARAIGASTDADGIIAGIVGKAKLGGLALSASWSIDRSSADTERTLVGGAKASSHYRLRGWVADVAVGYGVEIGGGWSLSPEVGFTHVSSRRGAVQEAGAGVFDLDVDGRRQKASFVTGRINLEGDAAARLVPWLSAGVRQQTSGRATFATARFDNAATGFTVPGTQRSKTLATVDAGVSWNLSAGVSLYGTVGSEFGGESSGQNANAGLRIKF